MTYKKRCRVCGKEKDISEFGKSTYRTDGCQTECHECRRRAYYKQLGGTSYALRRFSTNEIIDEVVRRATIYDLLSELPEEDVVKYLQNIGYAVVSKTKTEE